MLHSENNITSLNRGDVPNCHSFNDVQNGMQQKIQSSHIGTYLIQCFPSVFGFWGGGVLGVDFVFFHFNFSGSLLMVKLNFINHV